MIVVPSGICSPSGKPYFSASVRQPLMAATRNIIASQKNDERGENAKADIQSAKGVCRVAGIKKSGDHTRFAISMAIFDPRLMTADSRR